MIVEVVLTVMHGSPVPTFVVSLYSQHSEDMVQRASGSILRLPGYVAHLVLVFSS